MRLDTLQADITEIKSTVTCFAGNLERLERVYLVEHEKLVGRVDKIALLVDDQASRSAANTRRISELADQVIKLEKAIQPLIVTNKILSWLFGILGASVLGLIWSLITGQVTLVVP